MASDVEKTWRCFHCDEVFLREVDARNHFGISESAEPACRIKAAGEFALLQALRNAESLLARYRAEDSDVLRAMHGMLADQQRALAREEEKGYARGLRDAKAQIATTPELTEVDAGETIRTLRYQLEQFAIGADLTDRQRKRLREIARTEVRGGALCRDPVQRSEGSC